MASDRVKLSVMRPRPTTRVPEKNKLPRAIAIDEEADEGGEDTHLQTAKACSKGYLGIAPSKFPNQWLKKCGKTIEGRCAYIETNGKAGEHNPPSIEDSL